MSIDEDDILARYEWAAGDCFRCARTGLDTAAVHHLRTQSGEMHDVRACRACALSLEGERRRDTERLGRACASGTCG